MGGFRSLLELVGVWLSLRPSPGQVTLYTVLTGTATTYTIATGTATPYTLATGTWVASEEFPHGHIVDYYHQILGHVGYFAICGAQGCIRGCMDSLEKRHAIGQSDFPTAVSPRGQWKLRTPDREQSIGIPEGSCAELYREPDLQAGKWA